MSTLYDCQRCTGCCRWPGQVRVSHGEIERIAAYLGMDAPFFIERHTRLRMDRKGLSLLEKPGGECEFLDGADCRIESVKPRQCRAFPNLWNFPGFEKVCHAIPREVSQDAWREWLQDAAGDELDVRLDGRMEAGR